MILVEASRTESIDDLQSMLQRAIQLELSTLPPYLYALYSVSAPGPTFRTGPNDPAQQRILDVVREEMIHLLLAANVLNAIGGEPLLADATVVPTYPGQLPFGIADSLLLHLLPFSPAAMAQAMAIEEPEDPIHFEALAEPTFQTIGQFYDSLREPLRALPTDSWNTRPGRQIGDATAFPGELFEVRDADGAVRAIDRIVSQGEGTSNSPLDFEGEVAHFYRFSEIDRNQVLARAPDQPNGYAWGDPLGIEWGEAIDAIADPELHDFSDDPAASALQDECDRCFTTMLAELQLAITGDADRLGRAVRSMFELRIAALAAFAQPLVGSDQSAGPAFRYRPDLHA